jgi:flagellar motor switch protein FliN/FliY
MASTDNNSADDLSDGAGQNLKRLENIQVQLTVEVGGTKISIGDLMKLNDGSVVELERLAGEHLDILVNGTLLARGEVVLVGERLGIRFTEIISPEKRARSL